MKKTFRRFGIIFITLCIFMGAGVTEIFATSVSAQTQENYSDIYTEELVFMSDEMARSFIGFIYNKSPNDISAEEKSIDDIYNYLTGKLSKGSKEYVIAQESFVATVERCVNLNSSASYKLELLSTQQLIEILENKIGDNTDVSADVANQALGDVESSIKKILYYICKYDDSDTFLYIDNVMSGYKSLTSIAEKVENFLLSLDTVTQSIYIASSHNTRKAYDYYTCYVNNRGIGQEYLEIIMDAQLLDTNVFDGINNLFSSLGFGHSWTDEEIQRLLRTFGEFTYHSKLELQNLEHVDTGEDSTIKFDVFETISSEDLEYNIENNNVTITKYKSYNGKYHHVVIPDTIDGNSVVAIANNAFENINFDSIIIPNSIKKIGDYAFYGNPSCEKIIVLGKDTKLGNKVFDWILPTGSNVVCDQTIGNVPIYCEDDSVAKEFAENNEGFHFESLDWDGTTIWGIAPQNNVYNVYTAQQLAYIAYLVNNGNSLDGYTIKIDNNIYLNDKSWTPIGNSSSKSFSGSLDGNDHIITGLRISNNSSSALFGYVNANDVTFKNITISGDVSGSSYSAGLIGVLTINSNGKFCAENIYNQANITNTGEGSASGIVSEIKSLGNASIEFNNCRNVGTITNTGGWGPRVASGIVGNIVSSNTDTYTFYGCLQNGKINQRASAGYSSGDAGGIIAHMDNGNLYITQCAVVGEIYAQAYGPGCGGLIGYMKPHSFTIENCEMFAYIHCVHNNGDSNQAGMVGGCYADYYDSTSEWIIRNSYVSAVMEGSYGKAALVINNERNGASLQKITVENCYFDVGKTSITSNRMLAWTAILSGCNTISTKVTSSGTYSSYDLKTAKSLYSNWDFEDVWEYSDSGYPKLKIFSCEPCSAHSYEYEIIAPTCVSAGTSKYTCSKCHYNGATSIAIDPSNHVSSDYKYEINLQNPSKHDKKHVCCNAIIETTSCSYVDGVCLGCGLYEMPITDNTGFYLIYDLNDYIAFAQRVNAGHSSLNAILMNDIALGINNIMIGTKTYPYKGIFNGNGHTLSFAYSGKTYLAPFAYVTSATLKNITVEGNITISGKFAAGLVANASSGTLIIENCLSKVNITSTCNGDGTHGGLVAENLANVLNMKNCGFVGSIIGTNTTNCGGLIGWSGRNSNITNCYVAATFNINTNTGNSNTFSRNAHTLTNCYYLNALGSTSTIGATQQTSQQFENGEVAFKLGTPWGQNIDGNTEKNPYPIINGAPVYYGYVSCENDASKIYTNSSNANPTKPAHTVGEDDNDCSTASVCTACGEVIAIAQVHQYDDCSDATCSNYGCSVIREPQTHVYSGWYELQTPTCIATGTDERECTVCHHKETKTTDAKGHINAEAVVENKVDSNCITDGSYDSVIYCSICSAELSREQKTIDKLGHSHSTEWTIDVDPTCITVGSKSHHCSRCDDKTDITEIPANGHSWGNWYETKVPTCTATGTDERECTVCHHKETKTTDAKGHINAEAVVENKVDSNCITDGSYDSVIYCSICSTELSREQKTIDKLGHSHSTEWTIDVDPTCITVGSKSHHCSRCDDKTDITEIPANGHSWGNWYETKVPTCTATGTDERECSVCHHKETRTTDANEHIDATVVVENKVDSNCTTAGSYDNVVYCSVCCTELSREQKTIDKLGHSHSTEWTIDVDPTCITVGSKSHHCSRCGDRADITEVVALGHSFINYKTNNDATYTENGTETAKCDRCTVTDTRTDGDSALGLDQKFKDEMAALSKDANTETAYAELYSVLLTYSTLSDAEKANVATEYATLQQLIEEYNAKAQVANTELADATEIAFAPIATTGFVFLAALWFLLRKKFFI